MIVLVLGGNSEIGLAAAEKFAEHEKAEIILASRNEEKARENASALADKFGVKASGIKFDALDYDSHREFYESLESRPDVVIQAFGVLINQKECQQDFEKARQVIEGNLMGAISILEIIAADFEQQGKGTIIGLSSVAGERGRQSSYIYASAKAGLTVYLDGLRHRLYPSGAHVITVLPGFVPTKMVAGRKPKFGETPLPVAGRDIYEAWKKGKHKIYTGKKMRWVMARIKALPEWVILKKRDI